MKSHQGLPPTAPNQNLFPVKENKFVPDQRKRSPSHINSIYGIKGKQFTKNNDFEILLGIKEPPKNLTTTTSVLQEAKLSQSLFPQSAFYKGQYMNGNAGHIGKVKHNPHRSLHSKAFTGILGPGGAGGSNFLN